MRSLCSLACLAACTFTRAEDKIDAPPPPDTPDDGEFMVIETLTVPSIGAAGAPPTAMTSKTVLQAGVTYRLRASGTYFTATVQTFADAEYYDVDTTRTPQDAPSGIDVGLAINNVTVGSPRTFKWGAYNTSHVYEVEFTGEGAAITALLHDGNYSNNAGTLALQILARK